MLSYFKKKNIISLRNRLNYKESTNEIGKKTLRNFTTDQFLL